MKSPAPHKNRLSKSGSPYLLQHQHNPVDWYQWGEEALERAQKEEKPIIVSIGYSACHWCHVMERESFEDEEVAALMNKHFVCIKVDREERPDVDQVYMDAVQAMGIQGGWPLNVFLTPAQKPFYGGTYFPKDYWMQMLKNVSAAYRSNREDIEESAEKFAEALNLSESQKYGLDTVSKEFREEDLKKIFDRFSAYFDTQRGGLNKAPKFPMPSHWQFSLRYQAISGQQGALKQVNLTLTEMAWGGIYDQLGGGFSRYSVDADWFAPHFEKMLYDNGQLLSLYSEAYTATKNPLYKKVVYQTIEWAEREMLSPEGGFYAALDADSEGEEGKFYCWSYAETEEILGGEAEIFSDYYNISEQGNWEEGKNILHRRESTQEFAAKYELDLEDFEELLAHAEEKMLKAREKRIRPGLDDKIIAGWNGMMLTGLADAYAAFGEQKFLDLALKNAHFINTRLQKNDQLMRTYIKGHENIAGYMEDYAFVIQGYIRLYGVCFDPQWLYSAKALTKYVIEHFYDQEENLFFFTGAVGEQLIARKKELFDNVIPSSNSAMAMNLHRLGLLLDVEKYQEMARQMTGKICKLLMAEPSFLTNWACVYAELAKPVAEIAIVGPLFQKFAQSIYQLRYHPNKVICAAATEGDLPLLENREPQDGETTIYVCYNRTCQRPVNTPEEAMELL